MIGGDQDYCLHHDYSGYILKLVKCRQAFPISLVYSFFIFCPKLYLTKSNTINKNYETIKQHIQYLDVSIKEISRKVLWNCIWI